MCIYSMVMDQYRPWIPDPGKTWPNPSPAPNVPIQVPIPAPEREKKYSLEELRELLDSFQKAAEAAKVFDRLTGQPDCEDPEKAELEKRVEELERKLSEVREHESEQA